MTYVTPAMLTNLICAIIIRGCYMSYDSKDIHRRKTLKIQLNEMAVTNGCSRTFPIFTWGIS